MNQNQLQKTQVIIVGAGPTGLSMAVHLMRYDIDFVILEKNEHTTQFSKAIVVQARTLEIFNESALAEKAIREGQVTTGVNVFYQGKRKAGIDLTGLGEGQSPYPFALSLEQSKTEKLLADFLLEHGRKVHWKCEVTNMEQDANGVNVFYNDHLGQEQKLSADYVVGCDGASSFIRHQMHASFEGDTVPKIFYVADVKIKSPVINRNQLYMFMIPRGFILFFPMEGTGHYRIVGILPDPEKFDEHFRFEDIEQYIINEVMIPLEFEGLNWFSTYKVHSRKANAFANGRCFIAGDAAHIHTPAGGQGMNTGIQDAYNLAWKMALTLKGLAKEELLKTYAAEREENARHLLNSTDRMFDIFAGVNPFWNFIRLNLFTKILGLVTSSDAVRKRVFPLISQTGIRYSPGILTTRSSIGKVKSGVRMPYFTFSDGTQILEYLTEPVFKLLFFGKNENSKISQLAYSKIPLEAKTFTEIPQRLFGRNSDFYILLRPDNHISYIGKNIHASFRILDQIALRQ